MLKNLLPKYVYKKHAKDLVRYCNRYLEIFFTKPQLIQSESGHKRAWICDAMRKFGMYYDRKMHNPELNSDRGNNQTRRTKQENANSRPSMVGR